MEDIKNNLCSRYISRDHYQKAFFEFSILRRKIRKWIKDESRPVLEIVNFCSGIRNTFKESYILEVIQSRYDLEERKIVMTILQPGVNHNRKFRLRWQAEVERMKI